MKLLYCIAMKECFVGCSLIEPNYCQFTYWSSIEFRSSTSTGILDPRSTVYTVVRGKNPVLPLSHWWRSPSNRSRSSHKQRNSSVCINCLQKKNTITSTVIPRWKKEKWNRRNVASKLLPYIFTAIKFFLFVGRIMSSNRYRLVFRYFAFWILAHSFSE